MKCSACAALLTAYEMNHATDDRDPDHAGICCDCLEAKHGRPRKPYPETR